MKKSWLIWVLGVTACAAPRVHHTQTLDTWTPPSASQKAQEREFSGEASLPELLASAMRQHPRLVREHARWRSLGAQARSQGRWKDPKLTYSFAPLPVETRLGPNHHMVAVGQQIPWPTKPDAMASVVSAKADTQVHAFDAAYITLRRDIILAYWKLWELDAKIASHQREMSWLKSLEVSQRARVETNRRPVSEISRVALMHAHHMDLVAKLRLSKTQTHAELTRAMGRDTQVHVTPALASSPPPFAPPLDIEAVLRDAHMPPHLQALKSRVLEHSRRRDLARLDRMPGFEVGAQWSVIDPGTSTHPDAGRDAVSLRVGVSVPIWEGATQAKIASREADMVSAQATLDVARQAWHARLRVVHAQALEANRRIKHLEETWLPQARAVHELVRGDYEAERAEFSALLATITKVYELERELITDRASRARLRARWFALLGRPSPEESP